MDTTLTTTFGILAKTLMYTIYNVNNQFIGLRQKLWFHCPQTKQLKQPFFSIDNKNVLAVNVKAKATHTTIFSW